VRIKIFIVSLLLTFSAGAINIEDYAADGIGEWLFKGRYTSGGQAVNATLEITSTSNPFIGGYEYQYVVKVGGSQVQMIGETITYDSSNTRVKTISGDGYGSIDLGNRVLYPLEPDPKGAYQFQVKKETRDRRVWIDWTTQFQGFKNIEFRGETVEALVMSKEIRRREYDPVANVNWRHDLMEDVTETSVIYYVTGYGPVRLDFNRLKLVGSVSSIDTGSFTLDSSAQWSNFLFEGAKEIYSGIWSSPWLGIFDASSYPEIDHINYGVMEIEGESDDFWIKMPLNLGWANSSLKEWPRAWISGLKGYYSFSEYSSPATLFFQNDLGGWVAVTSAGISKRSPVDPVVQIILPTTGSRVDVSVTGTIYLSSVIDNLDLSRVRNAYYVKGDSVDSPIVGAGTFMSGIAVCSYKVTDEDIDEELTFSAVFVDVDGNEWISDPIRILVVDTSGRAPVFGMDEVTIQGETGDLVHYELVTNTRADYDIISGGLPSGLNIVESTTGKSAYVSGIPTDMGTFRSIIRASNEHGADDIVVTVEITEGNKPAVISDDEVTGTVGEYFYYRIEIKDRTKTGDLSVSMIVAGGTTDDEDSSSSSLPKGLNFDETQWVLWGTPTVAGEYKIPFFVTNSYGMTEFILTLVVKP